MYTANIPAIPHPTSTKTETNWIIYYLPKPTWFLLTKNRKLSNAINYQTDKSESKGVEQFQYNAVLEGGQLQLCRAFLLQNKIYTIRNA